MARKITIDDLTSDWAREQVRRKLALQASALAENRKTSTSGATTVSVKKTPLRKTARVPNKNEAGYNRRHLEGRGLFEPVTFRLPGGSRYTPDYLTVDGQGQITLHEVKGSYRLHSHGRARTAFRECAAAFPMFRWVWATRQDSGEYVIETF